MGRPRKSLENHLLEGTYRADRHGPLPTQNSQPPPMRIHHDEKPEFLYPHIDMEPVPKMLISAESLAKLFDVSKSTVRRWAQDGDMPQPRKINGTSRWDADEIRDWIRSGCPDRDGDTNGTEQ